MATLPKLYFKGVKVKTFQYNGIEAFNATYKEKAKDKVQCYHKHQGKSGQSSPNGCYQKKTLSGGYCSGCTESYTYATGKCKCGAGIPCTNPVCGYRNDEGYGGEEYATGTRSVTHSSKSGCDNWHDTYTYELNCGFNAT